MSDELIVRTFSLRLATAEGTGRIVEGRCVPYGVDQLVRDAGGPEYLEVFHPGAFRRAVKAAHRVAFKFRHGQGIVDYIGRATSFTETDDGLDGAFQVVGGALGDHALALVDDEILTGLSVGFVPLGRERRSPSGAIIRDRVHLEEVSLVPEPAYVGALVTGRRSKPRVENRPADDAYAARRERLRALGYL